MQVVFVFEADPRDVVPPRIRVFNQQSHHEVVSVLFNKKLLQQEFIAVNFELAQLLITPILTKPKVEIETFRQLQVFCGNKGFEIENLTLRHSTSLTTDSPRNSAAATLSFRRRDDVGRHLEPYATIVSNEQTEYLFRLLKDTTDHILIEVHTNKREPASQICFHH